MSTHEDGESLPQGLPSRPAELEALIEQRREHLAQTLDELLTRAQPKEIARRSAQDVKSRFAAATRTETGELRVERVAAVAGAVLTVLLVIAALRRRRS